MQLFETHATLFPAAYATPFTLDRDDPFSVSLIVCAAASTFCYVLSILLNDYSIVDRLWSILPIAYAFIPLYYDNFTNPRLIILVGLITLWGTRMTYNFARKGGYTSHGEDYRWVYMRKTLHPAVFQLLNATFIAPFQNWLLLAFTTPVFVVYSAGFNEWTVLDVASGGVFLAAWLLETTADQQQWNFYQSRHLKQTDDHKRGFFTEGLFRYSRHPNFFAEQVQWIAAYGFSVAATGDWVNWSGIGVVVLILLFQSSTPLTEQISLGKYPQYALYQKRTSRLMPLWCGSDAEMVAALKASEGKKQ